MGPLLAPQRPRPAYRHRAQAERNTARRPRQRPILPARRRRSGPLSEILPHLGTNPLSPGPVSGLTPLHLLRAYELARIDQVFSGTELFLKPVSYTHLRA